MAILIAVFIVLALGGLAAQMAEISDPKIIEAKRKCALAGTSMELSLFAKGETTPAILCIKK